MRQPPKESSQSLSYHIALGGIIAALCIACMFLTGVFPMFYLILPMLASAFIYIMTLETGGYWGFLTYLSVFNAAVLTFFWVSVYVLGMKELLESLGDYGKYGGWILLGIANVMFFCYDFSMGSFPALYRRYLKPRISPGAHRES